MPLPIDEYRALRESLNDAEFGQLILGLLHYAQTGEEPNLTGKAATLWPLIKVIDDRYRASHEEVTEKNRKNGAKGGRPKKTEQETEEKGSEEEKAEKPKNPVVFSDENKKPKNPTVSESENSKPKNPNQTIPNHT
ncbi:MAG: DUF6291 domain-containing protein, partial [Clostridia bacterium]|nr:DUF6291 domain-containing protein [Clostridia bacterium]